ncbi:CYTH and CHAD domain-containing protein [Streptomyces sp. NPDC047000]|uniref:CYTH and CHAD domain-containing protein n=1 Tax=Streptomyces sp. NPDC047000 TaxID=3155474 RepID=UPI0033EC929E
MADIKREIERKYESDDSGLPDLTGVAGVADVIDKGLVELDATYYDTQDERLASAHITLRRRTGGSDEGWHLKFPVSEGVRDEIHAPLSDAVPRVLTGLIRSRVRNAGLRPEVRLRTARDIRHLVDADGTLLAEVSVDAVRAERLTGDGGEVQWTELEVELADDGDPAFLDKVEKRLRKAGVRPAKAPSKLARALAETTPGGKKARKAKASAAAEAEAAAAAAEPSEPVTAGDHVLAYLRTQRDAIVGLDPAVRRDEYDSVHRMRVAARRMRSVLHSYGKVLDRTVTDPVSEELRWLGGELGVDRDQEVLAERIAAAVGRLPRTLVTGPIRNRLRIWGNARRSGSRRRLIAVLDGRRYLTLLDVLDALIAEPPWLDKASGDPAKVIGKAVRKDYGRLASLVDQAIDLPPGHDRDLALHEARKKAKRTRYAAESAVPALGDPAATLVKSAKSLQNLLGEHQDSVMARGAIRDIAAQAHAAGESAFTYGLLYGREESSAAGYEAELPGLWASVREKTDL